MVCSPPELRCVFAGDFNVNLDGSDWWWVGLMFSANRNNIGYQNVAALMRHSAEYQTTGSSTAELSLLTDHAKNGW